MQQTASVPQTTPANDAGRNGVAQLDLGSLKAKGIGELTHIAQALQIPGATGMRKQDLIFRILQVQGRGSLITSEGVLECLPEGYGFLRNPAYSYLPGPDDVYLSPSQIRKFDLKTGDTVRGQVRPPRDGERYFAMVKVETINFEGPD